MGAFGCRWVRRGRSGSMSPRQLGVQLSFAATAALMALQGKHLAWRVPFAPNGPPCLGMSTTSKPFPCSSIPPMCWPPWRCGAWRVAQLGLHVTWNGSSLCSAEFGKGANRMSRWINGLEGLTWRLGWVTRAGLGPLVWGTALLWLCPLLQGSPPANVGQPCHGCRGVGGHVGEHGVQPHSDNHLGQRLWHVSARQPTWLMEDGWQGEVWTSSPRDSAKAANVVHHLGLSNVDVEHLMERSKCDKVPTTFRGVGLWTESSGHRGGDLGNGTQLSFRS